MDMSRLVGTEPVPPVVGEAGNRASGGRALAVIAQSSPAAPGVVAAAQGRRDFRPRGRPVAGDSRACGENKRLNQGAAPCSIIHPRSALPPVSI